MPEQLKLVADEAPRPTIGRLKLWGIMFVVAVGSLLVYAVLLFWMLGGGGP